MNLSDFIQKSQKERMGHLDLSTPCEPSPVKGGARKIRARKRILNLLGIQDGFDFGYDLCLCHRCPTSSTRGYCENPLHFYIGTFTENNRERMKDDPEVKQKAAENARNIQHLASAAALTESAKAKRKKTMADKKHAQGQSNSQYGTMWITNGETNKKIKKNEPIPESYYPGRKLK